MPDESKLEALKEIASTFDIEDIQNSIDYAGDQTVLVNIPAFKNLFQANMNDVLQKLGATSMFDPSNANFSNMVAA